MLLFYADEMRQGHRQFLPKALPVSLGELSFIHASEQQLPNSSPAWVQHLLFPPISLHRDDMWRAMLQPPAVSPWMSLLWIPLSKLLCCFKTFCVFSWYHIAHFFIYCLLTTLSWSWGQVCVVPYRNFIICHSTWNEVDK